MGIERVVGMIVLGTAGVVGLTLIWVATHLMN